MNKRTYLLIFILILVLSTPLSAQEPPVIHPLEDILRHIPSTEPIRQSPISYVNVEATHQSLDWIDPDKNYTFDSFVEDHPNGLRFINRWAAPPDELMNVPFGFNPAGEIATLDIFKIGQIARFGQLSQAGTIISGNFDTEELLTTYRSFAPYQVESAGNYHFVRNRGEIETNQLPFNFFDSAMKRALPLVIEEGETRSLIGNALSAEFYDALVTTFEHSDSSMWYEPYHQLTAQALIDWETTHDATLIQALWIPQATLIKREVNLRNHNDIMNLPFMLQPANPQNPMPAWAENYREITDFELPILLADLQFNNQMVFVLIVPFDYVGNAEYSALALMERLASFNNQGRTQSQIPLMELFNGTISHSIKQDDEQRAVALIAIQYDAPTPNPDDEMIYQADLFKTIYTSIMEMTFYPLWDVILP